MPVVVSVSWDREHRFSKAQADHIRLLAGLGVEGDAHAGVTVQQRPKVEVSGAGQAGPGPAQSDAFMPGLLNIMVHTRPGGPPVLRCGVMGIVLAGGEVQVGDEIGARWPPAPHHHLERV